MDIQTYVEKQKKKLHKLCQKAFMLGFDREVEKTVTYEERARAGEESVRTIVFDGVEDVKDLSMFSKVDEKADMDGVNTNVSCPISFVVGKIPVSFKVGANVFRMTRGQPSLM